MSDLTWDELDQLVDTDTIALRDRAWAEIVRLRLRVSGLETRNLSQGQHMAALDVALAEADALIGQMRHAQCGCLGGLGSGR